MASERFRHIFLRDRPSRENFTSVQSFGQKPRIPERDRESHSEFLKKKLRKAWLEAEGEQAAAHVTRKGIYLEFKSDPGFDLKTMSLEDRRSRSADNQIRLLNIRTEPGIRTNKKTGVLETVETTFATVFIPHEKKNHFLEKIEAYANETNSKSGKPKNADLVNSIGSIRKALRIDSFWLDSKSLQPSEKPEWCEIWLSSHEKEVVDHFEKLLRQENMESRPGVLRFPERAVKVVNATSSQLERLTLLSDDIAEFRRAKDTAAFWIEMDNKEQAEWLEDLKERSRSDPETKICVCILDGGINNGHPLLEPVLRDEDCLTANMKWGTHDHDKESHGHGTLMAGVAAYGDLRKCLDSRDPVFFETSP